MRENRVEGTKAARMRCSRVSRWRAVRSFTSHSLYLSIRRLPARIFSFESTFNCEQLSGTVKMMSKWLFLLAVLSIAVTTQAATVRSIKGSSPQKNASQMECLLRDNSTIRTQRRIDQDRALTTLFSGQMQFSLDLFKAMMENQPGKGNVFFSPMSVYSALLLAYFGSANQTEAQLAQAMGFRDVDKIAIVQAYKLVKFTRQLMRVAGLVKYDFDIVNRVYFNKDESIRQCMRDIFNDDIEMLDFVSQAEESRNKINRWIEEVTRDKIKEFATPDVINGNTRMALINAAYFKGQWASQFKAANTRPMPFVVSKKEQALANMMFQKGRFRHALSEELQAGLLEMPFLGDDVSFYILLPEGPGGLDDTISRLSLDLLQDVMSRTFPANIEIGVPKFRLEQTFNLRNILEKVGLTDLFDSEAADLSGFTGVRGLNIDAATHKAFVEVNEEGSEAAAATALVDLRMARPLAPSRFIADHPFLFFIYDNLSESILFMGVYRNPK